MAKTRRPSRHGAIEIQISARVKAPHNGRPLSAQLIQDAIQYRIEHGTDPDHIELRIVRWRHRSKPWRQSAGHGDEWARFGRLLQFASVDVFTSRSSDS